MLTPTLRLELAGWNFAVAHGLLRRINLLETVEMAKISPTEAIAHILPKHDRDLADRAIAQLDECGYRIVEKDPVNAAADMPTEVVPVHPAAAALRREMALT
ncbi:hypothetical protein [Bradyrhizobium sp.]|jgi:hypothetical protein|uniref:hypothetical protein n=1 Tax=Bradyrhizobium sp. TaxID=376 RepID=UPI003C1596EE